MKQGELRRLIRFCILMENGGGIITKSPGYLIEKFTAEAPALDKGNQQKYDEYMRQWKLWVDAIEE